MPAPDSKENSDLVLELMSLETEVASADSVGRAAQRSRYLATLRLVLQDCLAQDKTEQAEAYALNAITLFPDDDATHEALIHLYTQVGRTADAVRHVEIQYGLSSISPACAPSTTHSPPAQRQVHRSRRYVSAAILLSSVAILTAVTLGRRFHPSSVPSPGNSRSALMGKPLPAGQALAAALTAYNDQANYPEAERLCDIALTEFRSAGYQVGIAAALAQKGEAIEAQGDFPRAKQCYQEALLLRRQRKEVLAVAHLLEMLSGLAQREGGFLDADRMLLESQTIRQKHGDAVGVALCLRDRGILAADQCHFQTASAQYRECLHIITPLNKPEIEAHVYALQGAVARDQGDFPQARRLLTQSLDFWQTRRHPRWIASMKRGLAITSFYEGKDTEAATLLKESLKGYESVGDHASLGVTRIWQARVLAHQGYREKALRILEAAVASQPSPQSPILLARAWETRAEVVAQSRQSEAASLLARARAQRQKVHCPLSPVEALRLAPLLHKVGYVIP